MKNLRPISAFPAIILFLVLATSGTGDLPGTAINPALTAVDQAESAFQSTLTAVCETVSTHKAKPAFGSSISTLN